MSIEPEVSDAVETANSLPTVNRRRVATTVMVRDGETLVIGGLKLKSEYENQSKFPVLGDLPVFGLLFSSTKKASVDTETVIFITPKIIYPEY
ncbi:MAG: type II and III secretion system protein, partial [Firmicutes bacterium]|nr:type II and III secretion system protein [Bacillota bacterium]